MATAITRKAINKVLPRINWLRSAYQYYGQTGIVKNGTSVLSDMVIYTMDDGDTWHCLTAGYGEGLPAKIYRGEYAGDNFVEVAYEWMKGYKSRAEVVEDIYTSLCEVL